MKERFDVLRVHTPSIVAREDGFYRRTLEALLAAGLPFLVGGGYAMRVIADVRRASPDLDLFIERRDRGWLLEVAEKAGLRTEVAFGHWLTKIWSGDRYIDAIDNSGNGATPVDHGWFEHAIPATLFGMEVNLCPAEETLWSKSFVMERERCDLADVMHILRARAKELDWRRLVDRYGESWRVLLSHLVMFGFVYPGHAHEVPRWVIDELVGRLGADEGLPRSLCRGTLLSRGQYLTDVGLWGYEDARVRPRGGMSREEIARWTAAIERSTPRVGRPATTADERDEDGGQGDEDRAWKLA